MTRVGTLRTMRNENLRAALSTIVVNACCSTDGEMSFDNDEKA